MAKVGTKQAQWTKTDEAVQLGTKQRTQYMLRADGALLKKVSLFYAESYARNGKPFWHDGGWKLTKVRRDLEDLDGLFRERGFTRDQ